MKVVALQISIMLSIFLASCSPARVDESPSSGNARRALDEFYHPSGIVKYFLPDLPSWANGSHSGACHRTENIRYFQMKEISAAYNLNRTDILQAQMSFNQEKENILSIARLDPNLDPNLPVLLPPRQEEILFYQSLDKVQAKFYAFVTPAYKRINLLWADQFIEWKNDENNKLSPQLQKTVAQKMMGHSWATSGHPVLISLCLTVKQLEKALVGSAAADQNIRLLGSESMTPFLEDFKLTAFPMVPLSVIFAKEQELHLYSPDKKWPPEINGPVTLHGF